MNREKFDKAIEETESIEDLKKIGNQYSDECKRVLDKIITYLGDHIKEDEWYKDYVQECWHRVEGEYDSFEDWFDDTCYLKIMDQEGVQECLGEIHYRFGEDKFVEYLNKWGFFEWVNTVIEDKHFRLDYTKNISWCVIYPEVKIFVY